MRSGQLHGAARSGMALAGVAAMAYQLGTLSDRPGFRVANFASFFTIQSNVLAAVMLLAAALVRPAERSALFDAVRGAVTLAIVITGVVFALLLQGLQEQLDTHIPWVDLVVHTLVPLAVAVDWLLDPPRHVLPRGVVLAWLAYPLLWFSYTLVRGAAVGWYPYPFVDADRLCYGRIALNAIVLALAFAAGGLVLNELGRLRARRPAVRG